jgi:hypothetical protein
LGDFEDQPNVWSANVPLREQSATQLRPNLAAPLPPSDLIFGRHAPCRTQPFAPTDACGFSKLDPHKFIGGSESPAITCVDGGDTV